MKSWEKSTSNTKIKTTGSIEGTDIKQQRYNAKK